MLAPLLMACSGKNVQTIDASVSDSQVGSPAFVSFSLNTDGSIDMTQGFTPLTGNWFFPAVTGIGSSFWARLTGTGTSPGTLNVWLHLNSIQTWSFTQATAGSKSFNGTLEIATDSGGSNVVSTGALDLFVEVL